MADAEWRSGLVFRDLGPLMIERAGTVTRPPGRQPETILALLLVRANQRVSQDSLADALWGGALSDHAQQTLESHIWRLRRILEPDHKPRTPYRSIVFEAQGYRLITGPDQVDSVRFERLAGDARDLFAGGELERTRSVCDEALGLWRGEPWTPYTDEPWALAAAGRLAELRGDVEERRIDALVALGELGLARSDLEVLLARYPLRERLWELAMLASLRSGRTDEALAMFQRARRTLIEEVGLEPGLGLQDLHSRILTQDPDLVVLRKGLGDPEGSRQPGTRPLAEAPVRLPERRSVLVGRDSEIAELAELLREGPLTTVVGAAGCGKTSTLVAAGRTVADQFRDGVCFVDLVGAAGRGQVIDAVTSALRLVTSSDVSVTDALIECARSRQILIVLDNCEHVLEPAAEIAEMLLTADGFRVAATSREPLDVEGERVYYLTPLPVPGIDGQHQRALAEEPAVTLFLQQLTRAVPNLQRDQEVVEAAAAICVAVDGLPLAIELAASLARTFSLDEIAAKVRSDPVDLARIGRGGGRHHASLGGAIELSSATLTADEMLVHQAMATVPGPFTAELAAAVIEKPLSVTSRAIAGLVHRSMLTALGPQRRGAPSRFSQLSVIRGHGLGMLTAEDRSVFEHRRDRWVFDLPSARRQRTCASTCLFSGGSMTTWPRCVPPCRTGW